MGGDGKGKRQRVEPRLARGMQDFLPARAAIRQRLIDVVRGVYEARGFAPLMTSAIERWDALVGPGGAEANQLIFRLDTPEADELGLRFDLTVPLSRVVAHDQQVLPRPFRRYQVGPVWRLDKPGPGRYREFIQFDADIVGTTNPLADAEVAAALNAVFRTVVPAGEGVPAGEDGSRHRLRCSDRRLLDLLLRRAGIPSERGPDVLRVLDKLDRIGKEKLELELTTGYEDESGDPIEGLGLTTEQVAHLLGFIELGAESRSGTFELVESYLRDVDGAAEGLKAAGEFLSLLDVLGLREDEAELDPSLARGLAYYTGPVFEVELRDAPEMGSVGSGGRYDDLVGRFSGQPWPGVGVSVGIDRLLAALEQLGETSGGAMGGGAAGADVLVTVMDDSRLEEYVRMTDELREAGVRVELFSGNARSFGKQMKHADRSGTPVVLIAGDDEFDRGIVTVKRMAAMHEGETATEASRDDWLAERSGQAEVPRGELVSSVLAALGRQAEGLQAEGREAPS